MSILRRCDSGSSWWRLRWFLRLRLDAAVRGRRTDMPILRGPGRACASFDVRTGHALRCLRACSFFAHLPRPGYGAATDMPILRGQDRACPSFGVRTGHALRDRRTCSFFMPRSGHIRDMSTRAPVRWACPSGEGHADLACTAPSRRRAAGPTPAPGQPPPRANLNLALMTTHPAPRNHTTTPAAHPTHGKTRGHVPSCRGGWVARGPALLFPFLVGFRWDEESCWDEKSVWDEES